MLSAEPVCSCALCFVQTARETAGAARTRSSLRPLILGANVTCKTSGASRRGIVNVCLQQVRRQIRRHPEVHALARLEGRRPDLWPIHPSRLATLAPQDDGFGISGSRMT